MKTCTKCGIDKDLSCFRKSKKGRFGVLSQCKDCKKISDADYHERVKNTPEYKAKVKKYYEENRQEILDYHKRYNIENSEKIKEYRKNNKESIAQRFRDWCAKNPEKVRARNLKAKAKRRYGTIGKFTKEDIEKILMAQRHKCAYCHANLKKIGYHLDHIIPLAKGGTNWPNNIQACCEDCNWEKNAKDPIDFAREMGKLI